MRVNEQMNAIWEQGVDVCKCGSYNIKVVDSRQHPDGSIRRTRICQECGNRIFTKEVVRDKVEDKKEMNIVKHLQAIMKMIRED